MSIKLALRDPLIHHCLNRHCSLADVSRDIFGHTCGGARDYIFELCNISSSCIVRNVVKILLRGGVVLLFRYVRSFLLFLLARQLDRAQTMAISRRPYCCIIYNIGDNVRVMYRNVQKFPPWPQLD
jgi:hypothetical protein